MFNFIVSFLETIKKANEIYKVIMVITFVLISMVKEKAKEIGIYRVFATLFS